MRGDAEAAVSYALLEDGSLDFTADPAVRALVEPWLPRGARPASPGAVAEASIGVEAGAPPFAPPAGAAAMELLGVGAWIPADGGEVLLRDAQGRTAARIDLAARRARVWLETRAARPGGHEVSATLTMCAALLLTRLRRSLVHASAVMGPGGGAWLLAGGSFSGKTTTCVNLIRGGWDYLSDDHVVLRAGPGGALHAEGWARAFNLDRGYAAGASEGVRLRVEPDAFGPGRWRSAGTVAGVLFPRVEAELPTAVFPLHPARALGRLLPNAPWLLADPAAAGPVLALLEGAARLPAYELRLGNDSYCNAQRLQDALAPALGTRAGPFGTGDGVDVQAAP